MRVIIIDPRERIVEERELKPGRRRIEAFLGDFAAFGMWLGSDAVYVRHWPSDTDFFRLGPNAWIAGRAVVAGAAAGIAGWRASATLTTSEVMFSVTWSDENAERPIAWLNSNGASAVPKRTQRSQPNGRRQQARGVEHDPKKSQTFWI